MRSRDRGKKLTNVRFLTRIPSFSLLSKGSGSDCGETMKTRIPPRENKPAAMFERIHPTKKRPIYLGRFLIGGVVKLNGIEHTKALHSSSQITGKLQGNLPCFYPIYHLKILEFITL